MYWYGDHVSGWGWLLMGVGMVTFWGVVLTGAVLLAHSLARPQQPPTPFPPTATPEQLLAQRFAQGEIDEAEYRDRLATQPRQQAPVSRRVSHGVTVDDE